MIPDHFQQVALFAALLRERVMATAGYDAARMGGVLRSCARACVPACVRQCSKCFDSVAVIFGTVGGE